MRTNQSGYRNQSYMFRKSRKQIETLFSQLCDRFRIRRNYAKSLGGFKAMILAEITALRVVQYINRFLLARNSNNITISVI